MNLREGLGYKHLSFHEKQAYKAVLKAFSDMADTFVLTGANRRVDIMKVIQAALGDNPSVIYFNKTQIRYEDSLLGKKVFLLGVPAKVKIEKMKLALNAEVDRAVAYVKSTLSAGYDEYELLIRIYEYLQANVKYNEQELSAVLLGGIFSPSAHNAYGALVDRTAVCDGFSLAFSFLAQRFGIECMLVWGDSVYEADSSVDHAWNIVKLRHKFYHFDVTWDARMYEQLGEYSYIYFALNDAEATKDHRWSKEITHFLIPLALLIDKYMRKKQYCTKCYGEFNLPQFVCPSCERVHSRLVPGRCGIMFAKCGCNKIFLPVMALTGRSRLNSKCPASNCNAELAAANSKQFFIHLIGGSNTGKTAYMATFANAYLRNENIAGKPESAFDNLNDMYQAANTQPHSSLDDYSFTYSKKQGKPATDTLVIYDINGEQVVNEYAKNPRHFIFCHGFMLFTGEAFEDVIHQFKLKLNEITGLRTGEVCNVPVAVITTDLESSKKCDTKDFPEINFTKVEYFTVKGFSRNADEIIAPVAWLAKQAGGSSVWR